jgi:hypothetical protein
VDEFRAAVQRSVYVLQIDYGASDIMASIQDFAAAVEKDPGSEEAMNAFTRCITAVVHYLDGEERDLLQYPADASNAKTSVGFLRWTRRYSS